MTQRFAPKYNQRPCCARKTRAFMAGPTDTARILMNSPLRGLYTYDGSVLCKTCSRAMHTFRAASTLKEYKGALPVADAATNTVVWMPVTTLVETGRKLYVVVEAL